MKNMEIKEIKELGDSFIGLWAYNYGKRRYCATIVYNDKHWDTGMHKTPEGALRKAVKLLRKLKKLKDNKK